VEEPGKIAVSEGRGRKYFGNRGEEPGNIYMDRGERQEIFLKREAKCQRIFIWREGRGRKYSGNRGVRIREYICK
jgi:hypothetical protein